MVIQEDHFLSSLKPSEYSSISLSISISLTLSFHSIDFLYKHNVNFEENHVPVEIEILDTCSVIDFLRKTFSSDNQREIDLNSFTFIISATQNGCTYDDIIRWADAFLIIYSIVDRDSFYEAERLLKKISKLKLPSYFTTLLLGSKNDLEHSR